jgi:hypothetical protein
VWSDGIDETDNGAGCDIVAIIAKTIAPIMMLSCEAMLIAVTMLSIETAKSIAAICAIASSRLGGADSGVSGPRLNVANLDQIAPRHRMGHTARSDRECIAA